MPNWEYKIMKLQWPDDNFETFFNMFGREGWELVSVKQYKEGITAYFKRDKAQVGISS